MIKLSPRQQAVLDYVTSYQAEHGYAPTLREIGAALQIGNTHGVRDHLDALRRKKRVTWAEGKSRTLRVLSPV